MKVLVVDDEPLVRRSLQKALERGGHEVLLASDGGEGLKQWQANTLDLVVLDILMPVFSGPEVISEFGDCGDTRVVLISAYSADYDLESVKKLGADLFIEKPFSSIQSVVQQLEKLVQDH